MKYILTALFFFSLISSRSQSFIEVKITDSILVKPDSYIYSFDLSSIATFSEEMNDTLRFSSPTRYMEIEVAGKAHRQRSIDSISSLLRSMGFKIVEKELFEELAIGMESEPMSGIITGSPDSLKMVHEVLKANKNIKAWMHSAGVKGEEAYYKQLFEKIMSAAKRKATAIASASGRKLGTVISVTEDNQGIGQTGYPPLSAAVKYMIPGWHTTIGADEIELNHGLFPISKSFTVRYAML